MNNARKYNIVIFKNKNNDDIVGVYDIVGVNENELLYDNYGLHIKLITSNIYNINNLPYIVISNDNKKLIYKLYTNKTYFYEDSRL